MAATSGIAYTYEIDGELTQMEHQFSSAGVTFTYDYNGAGQLTHEAASASGWLWDAPGPAESWSFASTDAVRPGEPTNNMNQYGSFTHTVDGTPTTATFSYDLYDNMSGDGTRVFTHDTRNRLLSIAQPGLTITYAYDVIGRRVSETHNGSHVAGYVHAGGIEIGEIDDQGRLIRIYVPGPGTDQRVSMIGLDPATQAVTSRHYYHANRQGSVIAMADQTGVVTDQYVYTPFGVETPFASSGNPFRYTGQRVDRQTGLYYYRARYYWPEIGRFLQTDPIGHADQLNLYAYVANDPLNYNDPTGMARDCEGWGTCWWANRRPGEGVNRCVGRRCSAATLAEVDAERTAFREMYGLRAQASMAPQPGLEGLNGQGFLALTEEQWAETRTDAFIGAGITVAGAVLGRVGAGSRASGAGNGVATTRVGRWMSEAELQAMRQTGIVQESRSGVTHVANPANPSTFSRQAPNGSVYVEFDVPTASLRSTSTGVSAIAGPRSVHSRLAVRRGGEPLQMPNHQNLRVVESVEP